LKKFVSIIVKIGISAGLIGFLAWKASQDKSLPLLIEGSKDWSMLALALLAVFLAVVITILRWHMLLRTLGLQFTLRESLRAGFVGYLFNLLPLGLAGADAVKAGFLIHRNPSRKTEAIATVIIDRVIGLYALLVLAGGGALLLDFESLHFRTPEDEARTLILCRVAQWLGLISTVVFGLLIIPGAMNLKLWDSLEKLPGVGGIFKKLVAAMRTYRQSSGRILLAVVMSFAVHTLYVAMVYCAGRGLMSPQPALQSHFVFTPISMVAGALPIGAFEATLDALYYVFSPTGVPASQGLLIALTYRVLQISVATIGVGYYLASRAEVQQLMEETKEAELKSELKAGEA
jgi:glycosyltransferase 2 family protein